MQKRDDETANPESAQPIKNLTLCSQAVDNTLTVNKYKSKQGIITVMPRPSDEANERSEWDEKEAEGQVISEGQVSQSSGNPSQTQTLKLHAEEEERKEEQGEIAAHSAADESALEVISSAADVENDKGTGAVKKDKSVARRAFGWVNGKVKNFFQKKIQETYARAEAAGDEEYFPCKICLIIISTYLCIFLNHASLIK